MKHTVSKAHTLIVSPDELRMLHTAVTDRINIMTGKDHNAINGKWVELQTELENALHS